MHTAKGLSHWSFPLSPNPVQQSSKYLYISREWVAAINMIRTLFTGDTWEIDHLMCTEFEVSPEIRVPEDKDVCCFHSGSRIIRATWKKLKCQISIHFCLSLGYCCDLLLLFNSCVCVCVRAHMCLTNLAPKFSPKTKLREMLPWVSQTAHPVQLCVCHLPKGTYCNRTQ